MIRHLKPLDRQVILSYLEGHDAAAISEITGLSLGRRRQNSPHQEPVGTPVSARGDTMTNELRNPAQKLWQDQPVEGITMSAEIIRKRAAKFEQKILWRNVREYVASLIATAVLGYFFVTARDVFTRVTFGLFIAGLVWMVVQLHRKGSVRSMPAEVGTLTSLQLSRGTGAATRGDEHCLVLVSGAAGSRALGLYRGVRDQVSASDGMGRTGVDGRGHRRRVLRGLEDECAGRALSAAQDRRTQGRKKSAMRACKENSHPDHDALAPGSSFDHLDFRHAAIASYHCCLAELELQSSMVAKGSASCNREGTALVTLFRFSGPAK